MKKAKWSPKKMAAVVVYWTVVRLCGVVCFHYGKKRDEEDLAQLLKEKIIDLKEEVVP